jgi:integrase/recombinase XerD
METTSSLTRYGATQANPDAPGPSTVTLAAWLLAYSSARTRDAHGRAWSAWAHWCAGHGLDPWHATRAHVDAWAREQEAAGAAPATVALRLTAISSAYTYAVQGW